MYDANGGKSIEEDGMYQRVRVRVTLTLTLSKTALRSRRMRMESKPESAAVRRSLVISMRVFSVLWRGQKPDIRCS